MSFGQPPPKTPYGDQDFEKEDFTPQTPVQPPFASRNPRAVAPNPAYMGANQQMPYGNQTMPPVGGPIDPYTMGPQRGVPALPPSLTPEDQIFMRSWRNDSFKYRVLPVGVVASSALFYYNKIKGLPQKISRYVGIAVLSVFVGNLSYRGELIRRLETSPLQTPFIKALREMTGVRPAYLSTGEFSGDDAAPSADWNMSDPAYARSQAPGYAPGPYNQMPPTSYGQYSQDTRPNQPYDADLSGGAQPGTLGGEPGKGVSSYEELRARNRGLLQK